MMKDFQHRSTTNKTRKKSFRLARRNKRRRKWKRRKKGPKRELSRY